LITIALIDDEPNILKALKRALGREHWNILTFDDPVTALDELTNTEVDLVISDYKMPQMTGVDFLKLFSKQHPDTLRIILSGQADLKGLMDAINTVGVYRFILKPWNDDELRLTIKQALAFSQLEKENRELVETVKKQSKTLQSQLSELNRLERESPGITKIDLNEDGYIDMSAEFEDE